MLEHLRIRSSHPNQVIPAIVGRTNDHIGIRVQGSVAAMDLFGGVQRMVDADPLDRTPRAWAFAGFRLVGK